MNNKTAHMNIAMSHINMTNCSTGRNVMTAHSHLPLSSKLPA